MLSVVALEQVPHGEPVDQNPSDAAKQLVDENTVTRAELDEVDGDIAYGHAAQRLARLGERVDLLIVGSRSYGRVERLFKGSTSNDLARNSPCALLVLPRSAINASSRSPRVAKGRLA